MMQPDPALPWPIDYADGVLPIAADEGCRLVAYKCPAGVDSCGYGETDGVTPETVWTQAYADQRFCESLTQRVIQIRVACTTAPTPGQLAAMTSLAYNVGMGAFLKSTVLRCHNAGDALSASRAFGLFNQYTDPKTGKRVVSPVLTARRARESALYLQPSGAAAEMPQAVDAQSSLASSPTIQAAGATAGAGILGLASQASDHMGMVTTVVESAKHLFADVLGVPAGFVLPGLGVSVAAVIIWQRIRQRVQGWA